MHDIPLSLYVHIPWCVKKCPYCDFNSHQIKATLHEDQYIGALIVDLKSHIKDIGNREVKSVFIGGGTPSVFSPKSIHRLIDVIKNELNLSNIAEITIEANPGTTDQENFSGFREAGVNRISIGVQSFSNAQLRILGRIHDSQSAIDAIHTAQQAGFKNINVDLMYALPQQNLEAALSDVEQAITLNPTHISYYQLTIEPNTSFYRQPPKLPDNQMSWEIQQAGMELLATHGYQQYEISAYAKKGYRCVHNTNYWLFGDYLGIGAGAHQKLTLSSPNLIHRREKPKHPQQYINYINNIKLQKSMHGEALTLAEQDIIFEFMLNALRLKDGFTKQQFETNTGLAMQKIEKTLQSQITEGLLKMKKDRIHCSDHGYKFLNDILQTWLPQTTVA